MTYGSIHRFLLRSIASRGVISVKEAEKLLNSFPGITLFHFYWCNVLRKNYISFLWIPENENSSPKDLIKDINEEIRPFQQTIKITNDEVTSDEVIVFLSLGYDDATKAQNVFSKTELEYFRVLIEQIMTTASRQITGIHAINLVNKLNSSYTKTDAQVRYKINLILH